MRKITLTGSLVLALAGAALGAAPAQAEQLPPEVQAQLPLSTGEAFELCPVADLTPADVRRRVRRARQQFAVLTAEVARRPQAEFVRVTPEAHGGEDIRDPMTVLSLAEEHLEKPGIEKAPCARTVLSALRDAVLRAKGQTPPAGPPPVDEPIFLVRQTATALSLRQDGAGYRSSRCPRGIAQILTSREEVRIERENPRRGLVLVTAPERTVGVLAVRPTDRCRAFLKRRLAKLAAHPFRV